MFQVKDNECVGFDSKWKVTKVSIATSSQTTNYSVRDAYTAPLAICTTETQTDAPQLTKPDYDEARLSEWLSGVYSKMKGELDDANTSQAFKDYFPDTDEADVNMRLIKKVKIVEGTGDEGIPVSALTWNSTGNKIAGACNHIHKTWCHHVGCVKIYVFVGNDLIHQKSLKAQSCVTCLKFHPNLPFILAGGTYSGEIIIWNTENDDDLSIRTIGHEEALTQITWISDIDTAKTTLLATSSLDGNLSLWNYSAASMKLTIKEKFTIKAPIFGKNSRKGDTPVNISKKVDRGIIAFDFSPFFTEMFVVGAEGGLVVLCNRLGLRPLSDSKKECPISDPSYRYFSSHEGEITCIKFSPDRRELFVTNGSEGEIRFYTVDREEPASIIHVQPLQMVTWVPFAEKLLAAIANEGFIKIYDILEKRLLPNTMTEKAQPLVLTQIEINSKRISTCAVGTKNGDLQLWLVPWNTISK